MTANRHHRVALVLCWFWVLAASIAYIGSFGPVIRLLFAFFID